MKVFSTRKLMLTQTVILLAGTLFTWSKLIEQINIFLIKYDTLFRFQDITIPNPFTTPCLYGSSAFLIALFWSYYILLKPNKIQESYLRNFLIFCVIFAGTIVTYEFTEYYKIFDMEGIIKSCSPGTHPLKTPCFYGLLFFVAASTISVLNVRKDSHI
ncbi:MAG: hypothetical protein WCT07_02145 [Candidatus Paceibacterota bacterium]|jgi:hypothetical protein